MTDPGHSPRERYRTQVRADIKRHAWEQIATAGVSALSLNAIAKLVGMSGPALYRYFASRDDLITELIRDAYRSLADTVAAAAKDGADLSGLAWVIRDWARADPQRYFLIFGTPVPGYHAPDDTTAIAAEVMAVLLDASELLPAGEPATPLETHLDAHRAWIYDHPATGSAIRRALTFWTRLHGILSLDLAGQFANMDLDLDLLIAEEIDALRQH
ncbi:TetR/AcrR family transcriptional regulator [Actinokineospora globicatena]|uniref:TetR family transcriptional regulator n=1 Tax=Actinokineospora globicatena TaxID=103729 RepID=A0A9W6V8T7_9PSEU|nr:TetR/AcrR family transcriptional regulator [Actinokineospora globicatena]GLW90258.1 TetR family transcriptional regulator [Actinokineospora globicatena]